MKHNQHLKSAYPELAGLIDQVGTIPELRAVDLPVAEAITRIVTGQMLSRSAAHTIYSRVVTLRESQGLDGSWKLSPDHLSASGLSRRKVRAIKEFGELYDKNPESYEGWRHLVFEKLTKEVDKCWGLSHWTAAILALFYFANEDVFPVSDGSICRAVSLLESKGMISSNFDSGTARPFRSYLALYLWAMLDQGLVSKL